ncbi:hypothetical protein [Sphingobium chlorophenolicum]|uniref:hypothetical protein n=1 Tax=Sphingobium chlorophenolicum TaxID=46429 RepID=UPI00117C0D2F|nr:hypothetical protein [Sphingobium chlorophenolicum]
MSDLLIFLLPPLCWFGSQQLSGLLLHACYRSQGRMGAALIAIPCFAAMGPALSLGATPRNGAQRNAGLLWSAVFALAIIYQGLAAISLPACRS